MSKLINKIEEKLGGGSNSNQEQSKLQKVAPESSGATSDWGTRTTGNGSGAPESVRHPISTATGPSGTAVDGNYSSTSATQGRVDTMPGGYSASRHPQSAEGQHLAAYTTTNKTGGTTYPASQAQEVRTVPGTTMDAGIPSQRTEPGVPTMNTAGYTKPTAHHYPIVGNTIPATQSTSAHPTADYSRDAGIVGRTGAAGVGAYEVGKHSDRPNVSRVDRDTISGPGGQSLQDPSRRPFLDDSAGRGGAGAMGANTAGGLTSGSGFPAREESAEVQAKKMSDAYQAGYRDAVEHMKDDMQGR